MMRVDMFPSAAAPSIPAPASDHATDLSPAARSKAWRAHLKEASVARRAPQREDGSPSSAHVPVREADIAVRFDARPIVGPVGAGGGAELGYPTPWQPQSMPVVELPVTAVAVVEATSGARLSTIATQHTTNVPRRLPTVTANNVTSRLMSHRTVALFSPARSMVSGTTSTRSTPAAVPSATLTLAAALGRTFARIVAVDGEIRIFVHGTLSGDDRDTLIRTATDALVDTPLAGRPLRIVERGGRA